MSSVSAFTDPSETLDNAVFPTDDTTEVVAVFDEPQDTSTENTSGRILGIDPLATASDLGII